MENPDTYNTAAQQEPTEHRSGHWQPALRPETPALPSSPQWLHQHRSAAHISTPSASLDDREARQVQAAGNETDMDHTNAMTLPETDVGNRPIALPVEDAPAPLSRLNFLTSDQDELEDDGDSERLDPAWGLKRMSTAQILGSVHRTSSFPTFTATAPDDVTSGPVQQWQEGQETSAEDTELNHHDSRDDVSPSVQSKPEFSWETHEDPDTEQFLRNNHATVLDAHKHSPEQSRYEEGMPLIQDHQDQDQASQHLHTQNQPLEFSVSGHENEESSYFPDMSESQQAEPKELTRKSTSTVLNSLAVEDQPWDAEDGGDFFGSLKPEPERLRPGPTEDAARVVEATPEPEAEGVEDVWQAMAEDDEFLVDDPDDLLPDSEPSSPSSFIAALKQDDEQMSEQTTQDAASTQRPYPARQSSANHYTPHQPSTAELSQLPSTPYSLGLASPALGSMGSFQSHIQQQRPAAPQPTQSFVDQTSGYQSPYDLPMELSKPKKRPAVLQQIPSAKNVPPPPRSSSMTSKDLQSPFFPSGPNSAQPSPAYPPRGLSGSGPAASKPPLKQSSSSFFEELPMTSKPRTGSGGARYTPQQSAVPVVSPSMVAGPPQGGPVQSLPQPPQPPQAQPTNAYGQFQLQQPERLDPFSSQPLQSAVPSAASVPAPVLNRYSPAPPVGLGAPRTGASPRYSPAPPPQAPAPPALNRYASQPALAPSPPTAALPFQPRTSSPLVHHKSSRDESQYSAQRTVSHNQPLVTARYGALQGTSPPQNLLQSQSPPKATLPLQPPRRSQTQSPSKQRPLQTQASPQRQSGYRPASAHGHVAPIRPFTQAANATPQANSQARGLAEQFDFIQPTDETRSDPLERWKGAPVFRFGFGGTIVSTFPKHVPRYSAGAVKPQIKPAVGDVSVRESKAVIPAPAHVISFPGPLRVKSKKKELLVWLAGFIADLESAASTIYPSHSLPNPRKRHDEKILLWKTIRAMVEHDGALDSGEALKAINAVLAPEVHAVDEATATQYGADISPSVYRPTGTDIKRESVDPLAIDTVRKHLLRGSRKEAVWHAVDNRLWSHAFLIGSTMPRDTWKQIVSEFVKQEVKSAGANTESLSTLYEIFGGNGEDCVDQLVPPSARAGLQMVSRIDSAGPTKNALDGLDKWQETLSLIINNRSHGDHQALLSLGRLLAEYGRVEAAHICFLFSRSATNPTVVGGLDDPQASIVLLGADHRKFPSDFARDLDSIILTEVYEFATLVLTGSATAYMPYLSTYKLRHASLLSEDGSKAQAQAYCDALTLTLRNTKAMSSYAPAFLGELDDFSSRLKQVPMQSSSSWMNKPNLEKVSGSILSKLSNFVAGDDSDADSKGSGREPTEAGPFANVAGTPSLSRATSQSDINFTYPTSAPQAMPTTAAGSRYAPNGLTSARSSSEMVRGRPSLDSQRSPPSSSYGPPGRTSAYDPVNMMQHGVASPPTNPYQSIASPPANHYQATPPQSSYMPNAGTSYSPHNSAQDPYALTTMPPQESYIPTPPPEPTQQQSFQPEIPSQPYLTSSQMQTEISEQPMFGGYAAPQQSPAFIPAQDETQESASEPVQSYGYAPTEDTGYVPYVPEPDSPVQTMPKKKSFMDDDDGYAPISRSSAAAAESKPTADAGAPDRKAANNAAADAAFRAAAEADAARDQAVKSKASGSWLGGWFSVGKKSDSLDMGSGSSAKGGKEPMVHRAKLGESKMKLYYDKDLKKWVNPDNPVAAQSAPTPPPPRAASGTPGPPTPGMGPSASRGVSAAPPMSSPPVGLPGSGPPSRAGTPASGSGAPGISSTLPPSVHASLSEGGAFGGLAPPSGPPSRPSTAMSNASSIDDLLGGGPPAGGKRAAKGAKAKKGRYVDVMAK